MDFEKVTAEIRPRTQWEAIDLGVRLTAEHAPALVKGWMASVYPFALVILALSYQSIGWGVFLIWWCKPLWERVALYPLSRSLFGEHPGWRETMEVLPRELLANKVLVLSGVGLALAGWWVHPGQEDEWGFGGAGLVSFYWLVVIALLFYRSGPSRSLALPVRYLEGLDRAQYRTRLQTLSYRGGGAATGLMVICLLLELLLFSSQVGFVNLMIPRGMEGSGALIRESLGEGEFDQVPNWLWMIAALLYLNALSVVAWFYTGAGFGLYLNTRIWTEGWDIELKFKGLGQRLGLLVLALLVVGGTARVEANQEAQRILEREEFEVETRDLYEKQDPERKKESSPGLSEVHGPGIFAGIGQGLFWAIAGLVVAGLIWVVVSNAHLFKQNGFVRDRDPRRKVRTVAGLNVEPESLPGQIVATARGLWEEGRHQEALGLLYRGAISALVSRQLVEIEESDTEYDCLRRVSSKGEPAHASYFKLLTEAWVSQAYARRTPEESTAGILWREWPFDERRVR